MHTLKKQFRKKENFRSNLERKFFSCWSTLCFPEVSKLLFDCNLSNIFHFFLQDSPNCLGGLTKVTRVRRAIFNCLKDSSPWVFSSTAMSIRT